MAVAHRLGLTRKAVYSWVRRLRREDARSLAQGLRGWSRSGRPREKRQAMQQIVQQVTETPPSQYGYQAEG
jgi:transposase